MGNIMHSTCIILSPNINMYHTVHFQTCGKDIILIYSSLKLFGWTWVEMGIGYDSEITFLFSTIPSVVPFEGQQIYHRYMDSI